jgi:octopine/nopaline transport system substrate-binding protein
MRFTHAVAKIALAAGVLAAGLLSAPAEAQQQNRWQTQGIRIATEGAYAPWNFQTPQGQLDGFEIELAAELCRRMNARCTVAAQDWDGIIPSLTSSRYDAIMAGMNITDRRLEVINFTRPYAAAPAGFGVPRNSPLARMPGLGQTFDLARQEADARAMINQMREALRGKTVGVQVATTNLNFLNEYFRDVVTIREYRTTEQHDLDLQNGRIDAIFAAHTAMTATFSNADFRDYQIAGAGFRGAVLGRGVAVGLRKSDDDLRAMFDQAIAAAIADGTMGRLCMKWFHVDITPRD